MPQDDVPEHGRRLYGAVVRVSDLPGCRRFYQELLGLGRPVVDSNFWVEFEMSTGPMVLALRHEPGARRRAGRNRGNVAWCLDVPDLEAFTERLAASGVHPLHAEQLPGGRQALDFRDPEGNPVVVIGPMPTKPRGT